MKSKGRYQKESRKLYRKNQRKNKKIRERLEKENSSNIADQEEKVAVLIPTNRLKDVNIGQDGNGNEWVFFKRKRQEDDDDDRRNHASSSTTAYRRTTTTSRRPPNPWSPEEEHNLKILVMKYTRNGGKSASWAELVEKEGHHFEAGRTQIDLKDKWRNMTKPKAPVQGKRKKKKKCT